jgi:cell division septal protein FtsQ
MIVAFFGMLITSIWYGTRVEAVTISEVTIHGGETIPHDQVEKIVRDKISGTYLKLVPRTFAFTYPHDEVESAIREMKRIKNLSIVRSGGTELIIEFDEYVPHALWCSTSNSVGCYFLDENGYSFSPAPSLQGGTFLRLVAIGQAPREHTQAFQTKDYHRVEELVTLLNQLGWLIDKAEIDAAGDGFLSVEGGGQFKVTLKQEAKETVDNLTTVLNSDKFKHIKPGNFEYVDLRFGDKVFVNEVTLETSASSTPAANASSSPVTNAGDAEPTVATTPTDSAPVNSATPTEPDNGVTISFDEPEE